MKLHFTIVSFIILCLSISGVYAFSPSASKFIIPQITQQQFDNLAKTAQPVFIAFHTSWCGGCRAQHKALASLLDKYTNSTAIYMIDWDKRNTLKIHSPKQRTTIVAYKQGKIIAQLIATTKLQVIDKFIADNSK